jgi:hypothetical protein
LQTSSLAAPDARARQTLMTMAGAVVFAAAITQTLANPIFVDHPSFDNAQPAVQAPIPTVTPLAAAAPVADFAFQAPTPGYPINSPFGLRRLPWEPRGRMHEGVDIAAPKGLPVGATLAGVVVRSGLSPTYGRFVEVRHAEGLTSLYAHLGSIRRGLSTGTRLAAGDPVGLVGNTGRSTGEHLHFEIRSDDRPLNPALFVGKTFASADDLPLDAAARFSRRVRLAVVSPETMARMMPKANRDEGGVDIAKTTRDGRVRTVLAMGPATRDPSPQPAPAAAEVVTATPMAASISQAVMLSAPPAPTRVSVAPGPEEFNG